MPGKRRGGRRHGDGPGSRHRLDDEERARRAARVPELTYPADLPVSAAREEIANLIRNHQVVVIAGETGSGKTTQIPKICLDIGRGVDGMIGHTQPRRIAARAVAERLAEELGVDLGGVVGYQVRFTEQADRDTLVKVMTDGILLAELARDRDLRRYDTIVIDEAHERSLNIDFLLGYLKHLLPRRPDLKVVITSATIDPDTLAAHFAAADGTPAPVIEVSGRTYPIEIRYRPLTRVGRDGTESDVDYVTGVCDAVEELWTEQGRGDGGGSDILVFLSGEREIRDVADALTGLRLPATEIVPLFARLSSTEQHRVFAPHPGLRRVVLATNVAETSLTVPGIRYVVDAGTARISRFSQRTKVQRLPIEPISQASANQRSGRCGRLADGIAIRLYSQEDFDARPEFTEPEILRTSLAAVILSMTALDLGEVADFPFVDPPDPRQIADGVALLEELRAVEPARGGSRRRLTTIGRALARLPVDPRLARMLIEANRRGVLAEVIVVTAALSIQDPRERPVDKQELATAAHRRFADPTSDVLGWLLLWRYVREQQQERSGSAFRRMCRDEFLHYLRIREWQDLVAQLRTACRQAGLDAAGRVKTADELPGAADDIHRSVLAGLLSHIGVRDEVKRDYLGARGMHFAISPGSALFRKQPSVVMAAELVETTRMWARTVASIDPVWAEDLGAHLVKRSHSEPRWSAAQGSAVCTERVTLYGVPIVTARTIGLARVDAELARDLFLRKALVEGDWTNQHAFVRENARLLEDLHEREARARRRDLVVGDEALYAFFDSRVPADVVSGQHFDRWWRGARRHTPDLLTFSESDVLAADGSAGGHEDFPSEWVSQEHRLALSYRFDPTDPRDGVTVHIPLAILNQVSPEGLDWLVPGFREDLVGALLRSLPKEQRRHVVPVADTARQVTPWLHPDGQPVTAALAAVLRERMGMTVTAQEFGWERVPAHLRVTFLVQDERGRTIAQGKDFALVAAAAHPSVERTISSAARAFERSGLTAWTVGEVPESLAVGDVLGFPALVDEGTSVSLKVLPTPGEAAAEHRLGVRRLLVLATSAPWPRVLARLDNSEKLALGHNPHGSVPALLADCLEAAVDAIAASAVQSPIRTPQDFDRAVDAVRTHSTTRVLEVVRAVQPVLATHLRIVRRLEAMTAPSLAHLVQDVRHQLAELVRPGMVATTGLTRLPHLHRYLRAVEHRLDKAASAPARDRVLTDEIAVVEDAYVAALAALRPTERGRPDVRHVAEMIEELRVSLFAQTLGTAYPISAKRVLKAISELAS